MFSSNSKPPPLFLKSMEYTKYRLTTGNSALITNTFPMPDPTAIPSCSACSEPIPDPAERWPDWGNGTVCQVCWEVQCSRLWWGLVRLLPEEGAHA